MGIKPCAGQIYLWERRSQLSLRYSTSEPLPHLICQHESVIIKLTHTSFVLWSCPRIWLVQYLIVMYTYRDTVFGWKCMLKMVSSMHNEADVEDYIVWHRIWICIDYLLFDLAAGVWMRMCTVHHLQILGPLHSWISLQCSLSYFLVWNRHRILSLAGEGLIHGRPASSFAP